MGGQVSTGSSVPSRRCASENADWMSALCPRLWDVPLHHLCIPGSHDTMTYCLDKRSPISPAQPRLLRLLSKAVPCVTLPVVLKWSVTQALDVTEQLDAGVRYLDLRIAHMLGGSEKNLRFVHTVYTTALVEDTLTEISEWLEKHPREVVILACRNFEGMTEDLHEYLVTCIKNIFGDMLCPRGEVPTLRQLWSREQQVLVSYEDESSVGRHRELWPGIPYWWGNKVKTEALICYLESMKSCGRPGTEGLPTGPDSTAPGACICCPATEIRPRHLLSAQRWCLVLCGAHLLPSTLRSSAHANVARPSSPRQTDCACTPCSERFLVFAQPQSEPQSSAPAGSERNEGPT
ncbi:PREDICTED: PI-PLC X domain-containing protein 1-like [Propithecus coquereli]|uniref:PI-PLC X domain-containing protein 1-like n=1 Tax=Propithecus coquereli TaxID=379532 RepID=UPI00063FA97F|nr:PREDICTED: PI-PLC X domain-containing protein 1-like [Propithecus coquereli]